MLVSNKIMRLILVAVCFIGWSTAMGTKGNESSRKRTERCDTCLLMACFFVGTTLFREAREYAQHFQNSEKKLA